MEGFIVYIYLAMLAAAAVGFFIGAVKYLRPRKPLYASMIVLGVGCIMIGKAYTILRIITGLEIEGIFHVGMLGTVGAFAFFFSANFGQIDSLVDDGGGTFLKYRLISLSAIIVTAAMYLFILLGPAPTAEKIIDGVVAVSIAAASYFHLKHIIIPDIDYGVVNCLRIYNALALAYGLLCMLEIMSAANGGFTVFRVTVCLLECVVSLLLVPAMDKGVQKWSK
ncbi:MAG: hypothetical protein J6O50_13545 [Ruminiclostridium sp.]|nr:hypothetical protein [Ruminiclostridium sp.]